MLTRLFPVIVLCVSCQAALAVDRLVPQQYSTIQAAIDAAMPHDTILISSGTYVEGTGTYFGNGLQTGLDVRGKSGLIIQGAGASETVVQLNSQFYGLMIDSSSNVVVRGLAIVNSYPQSWGAVHFFNGSSNCTLDHVLIRASGLWYSVIDSYYPGNRLMYCTVIGGQARVLNDFAQLSVSFSIDNSVLVGVDDLASETNPVHVSNTCMWQIADTSQAVGSANLFLDPVFVAPQLGDFRITLNTPCATASTSGGPIGALGAGEGDCDNDGVPDSVEIQTGAADCDHDGFPDSCGIAAGLESDCDLDGIIDACAIEADVVSDSDGNGVPDVCECLPDVSGNGTVDGVDLAAVLSTWGTNGQGQFDCDVNNDGVVDGEDLAFVLSGWGPCQN